MAVEYKIRGDASQLKKELQSVTAKEQRLEQQTNRTKKSFQRLSTSADVATLSQNRMRRSTTGLSAAVGALRNQILLVTFAVTAVAVVFGKFIKEASKLEESQNAVNVVFREGVDRIREFGRTAQREVGLTQASFNQLASVTGALVKSMGLPMDEVADITVNLTKRAADMASVFDTDVSQALNAINSALRGQTEPLTRYAADTTINTLNQFALAQGIEKTVEQMTQQEKKFIIIQSIMEQTKDTADDFKNTQDSFANATRILTANVSELAAEIGSDFQNSAKASVSVLNSLVTAIRNVRKATTRDTTDQGEFLFSIFTSEETKTKFRETAKEVKNLAVELKLLSEALKPGDLGFVGPINEAFKEMVERLKLINDEQARSDFFSDQRVEKVKVINNLMKDGEGLTETDFMLTLQALGIDKERLELERELLVLQSDKTLLEAASDALITRKLSMVKVITFEQAKLVTLLREENDEIKKASGSAMALASAGRTFTRSIAQAVVHTKNLDQIMENVLSSFIQFGLNFGFNKVFGSSFAHGTSFAPGGPAVVGERGPEIVNLPRGASVTPTNRTTNNISFGNIVINDTTGNLKSMVRRQLIPEINSAFDDGIRVKSG